MPKKTRQQKIRADRNRTTVASPFSFSYSATSISAVKSIDTTDQHFIKADILKTLILGSLFMLFEVLVYFLAKK
jgi:hypothetical protein